MKIKIRRKINAPAAALWGYLADFSNIHRFHPLLDDSNFIEGSSTCEVGSTRQCDFKDGNYLKERIVDWKENSHYTINVYDTSMPVKDATVSLGVESLSQELTNVYMNIDLKAKYRLMAPMLYLMFKFKVGPKILKGLEEFHTIEQAKVAA